MRNEGERTEDGWCGFGGGEGEEGRGGERGRVEGGQALFRFLRDRDLELHSRARGSRH